MTKSTHVFCVPNRTPPHLVGLDPISAESRTSGVPNAKRFCVKIFSCALKSAFNGTGFTDIVSMTQSLHRRILHINGSLSLRETISFLYRIIMNFSHDLLSNILGKYTSYFESYFLYKHYMNGTYLAFENSIDT